MARVSEGAWFRKDKDGWYATFGGRTVSLGVKGRKNRKAAQEAFYKLMTDPPADRRPAPEGHTVRELVDAFLSDAAARLKPSTVALYRADLDSLAAGLGRFRVDRITPADLAGWLARLKVSDTTKAIRLRSVSACFGWAVKDGWLDANPVKRVKRPKARSRSEAAVIDADDHAKLLAASTPGFRPVPRVLHSTGARPGELARITAENFYPDAGLVRLNEHKADRTGRPRLIYLPPDIVDLFRTLAAAHPTGPLLQSRRGKAWTARGITEAMKRTCLRAGVDAIAYGYRHSFATDGLANGLPEAHVAELLGHSSTTMLHKHYAHLTARAGVMRNAAALVRPAAPTAAAG